jgi:hypothetical protein
MLSTPRPIYLKTELMLLPIKDFGFSRQTVRELYLNLSKPGGYDYANLDLQEGRPTLSTRRTTGYSRCALGNDRIVIEESKPEMPVTEFIGVVQTVLRTLTAIRPSIPPVVMQACKINCLSQPHSMKRALPLLAGKVANVLQPIEPFQRLPSLFGVRFRFFPRAMLDLSDETSESDPPVEKNAEEEAVQENATGSVESADIAPEGVDQPQDNEEEWGQGFMDVRFETWHEDPAQIYLEAIAQFPPVQELLSATTLDKIGKNIEETYNFLSANCKSFLDQFDNEGEVE